MGFQLVGGGSGDRTGLDVAIGDFDNDGLQDILITTRHTDPFVTETVVYMIMAADLGALDLADGALDGVIDLDLIAGTGGSYRFVERFGPGFDLDPRFSVETVGDLDGDGLDDFVIGSPEQHNTGEFYLLMAADLEAVDAADGVIDGEIDLSLVAGIGGSYAFSGTETESEFGNSATFIHNLDGDGRTYVAIGSIRSDTPNGEDTGSVYLLAADDFDAADAADGAADGTISLDHLTQQSSAYEIIGEKEGDSFGRVVTAADVDGDGRQDLIFGAVLADTENGAGTGAVYILAATALEAADAADGAQDGKIDASNIAAQDNSYRIIGDERLENAGRSVTSIGDFDGDGREDLLIGARYGNSGGDRAGEVFLLASSDLDAADAADGALDGTIDLGHVAEQDSSYQFVGRESSDFAGRKVSLAGDVDGDGIADLLIGARGADSAGEDSGEFYLISGASLDDADAADGVTDGIIDLDNIADQTGSYRFIGANEGDQLGRAVASAGDIDGDGRDDIVVSAYGADQGGLDSGEVYVIFASDLPVLDLADGTRDGVIDVDLIAHAPAPPPTAHDDMFDGDVAVPITGNLLADNGEGSDQGHYGTLLTVLTVDGQTVDHFAGGTELANGAVLTVEADGDFTYDATALAETLGMGSTNTITLEYTLSQPGGTQTDTATLTLSVSHSDGASVGDDVIQGTTQADIVDGDRGADTISGGRGADNLSGGWGQDVIFGGRGDDTIRGGVGNDTLTGNAGADVFVFAVGDGKDTITDFEVGVDMLTMDQHLLTAKLPPHLLWAAYATEEDNGDLVLRFGEDSLRLEGVSLTEMIGSLDVI